MGKYHVLLCLQMPPALTVKRPNMFRHSIRGLVTSVWNNLYCLFAAHYYDLYGGNISVDYWNGSNSQRLCGLDVLHLSSM